MERHLENCIPNNDMEVFKACFAELSPEAQKEIEALITRLRWGVKGGPKGKPKSKSSTVQMGRGAAGALLVALIRTGFLPVENEGARSLRAQCMRKWSQRG